jgi:chaperonin GroES
MAAKLDPVNNRIVVRRTENKSPGGIVMPDSVEANKLNDGVVVAVGPGRFNAAGDRVPCQMKAGDHVLFASHVKTEISVNGETFVVMFDDDVLVIVG